MFQIGKKSRRHYIYKDESIFKNATVFKSFWNKYINMSTKGAVSYVFHMSQWASTLFNYMLLFFSYFLKIFGKNLKFPYFDINVPTVNCSVCNSIYGSKLGKEVPVLWLPMSNLATFLGDGGGGGRTIPLESPPVLCTFLHTWIMHMKELASDQSRILVATLS